MRQIILASTSPRRQEILRELGLDFIIVPSNYEEDMTLPMTPAELVAYLANGKAEAVADAYPDAIVIAADTIVVLDEAVYGKPHTHEVATQTLRRLSGRVNHVLTGLTVLCRVTEQSFHDVATTAVYMKSFSDQDIAAYVATDEPLDKAGAYGIQGAGAALIDHIDGELTNVLGLPTSILMQRLKQIR